MRKLAIFIVVLMFLGLVAQNAKGDVIFADGFEAGNFYFWTSATGNWTTSGGSVHSGEKRSQIVGATSAGGDMLILFESTVGYKNLTLDYWYRIYDGLEATDYLFVDYTADGVIWQNLATYNSVASSAIWQEDNFSLPTDAEDNRLFGLRLRATLGSASDCVYFDDFTLSGQPVPEPASILVFLSCFTSLLFRRLK